jgi:hypothetical protein
MRFVLVILAVLCGIALLIELDTGTLEAVQVAGIGIICAALATVAPSTWPS